MYIVKLPLSRHFYAPSQSGELLEVTSPFPEWICKPKAVSALGISSWDLNSFPFLAQRLSACPPFLSPLPLVSPLLAFLFLQLLRREEGSIYSFTSFFAA